METLRDLELVRRVPPAAQLVRAADGNGMPTMVVNFSTFNRWYEINSWLEGHFLERTVPGAFRDTIANDGPNVKVLFDHGFDPQIGNKVLGAIDVLEERADGPVAEVPLFDTSYNRDLLPGLEAGVYGSSFRFRVVSEEINNDPGVSEHNPQGLPEKTVTAVRLFECGPVTFPANPDSTAGVRSGTDDFYEQLRARNPREVEDLMARARELRIPGPGEAAAQPDEQAPSHSAGRPLSRRLQGLWLLAHPELEARA